MNRDDCLLIGRNDHVVTVGSRDFCFRWLKEMCPDGEYIVRGPGIDLSFYRIGGVVYPCGGTVDGNVMPTRSLAECVSFLGVWTHHLHDYSGCGCVQDGGITMAYGIGDTLFDACEDIKRRLADGVTPEEAAPYIKLMAIMEALGGYWDRPPSDNAEYAVSVTPS